MINRSARSVHNQNTKILASVGPLQHSRHRGALLTITQQPSQRARVKQCKTALPVFSFAQNKRKIWGHKLWDLMKTLLHVGKKKASAWWQMKSGPKNGAHAAHTTEISDLGPHCWDRPLLLHTVADVSTRLLLAHPVLSVARTAADSRASGRLPEVMGWAEGRPRGRPSVRPPRPPSLPLAHPCCSAPRPEHQHPDGGEPVAALPNKNSPSHYSSASPGATRSPASLPGLRIWLCNHRFALPLLPSLL